MMRKALLYTALATVIGASAGGIATAFAGQGGGASGQKAAAMFDRCDKNGDGSVTADEFKACQHDSAERKFKRLDTNHDGKVTREEAQSAQAPKQSSGGGQGGAAGHGAGQGGGGMGMPGTGSSQ